MHITVIIPLSQALGRAGTNVIAITDANLNLVMSMKMEAISVNNWNITSKYRKYRILLELLIDFPCAVHMVKLTFVLHLVGKPYPVQQSHILSMDTRHLKDPEVLFGSEGSAYTLLHVLLAHIIIMLSHCPCFSAKDHFLVIVYGLCMLVWL